MIDCSDEMQYLLLSLAGIWYQGLYVFWVKLKPTTFPCSRNDLKTPRGSYRVIFTKEEAALVSL